MNIPHQNEHTHYTDIGKLAKGTASIAIGDIIGNVLFYLTCIIITRTIGADLYGLYFLGNIVIFICGMISRIGLDYALLRFVSLYKGKQDSNRLLRIIYTGLSITILLSTVMAVIIFLLSPWIANSVFKKSSLVPVLKILAISLPFSNISLVIVNAFLGLRITKFKVLIDNLIQPLTKLLFIGAFFLISIKLIGVLWATTISSMIAAFCGLFFLFLILPVSKGTKSAIDYMKLVSFSIPIFGENLLNYVIYWIDIMLLGYYATSADVGMFGVIFRITMVLVFIQYSFNAIFPPMVSDLYDKKEIKKIEGLFKLQTRWSFTLTLPMLLLIMILPKPILQIFGENFDQGVLALILMSVGRFSDASTGTCGMILMMIGKPKINTINSAIILVIKIVLNVLLIPRYGLIGAATVSSLSIVLINLMRILEVYYLLKIHPYNLKFFKPIISAVLSSSGFLIARWLFSVYHIDLSFIGSTITLFMFIYFYCLYLLKLDEEDSYLFKRFAHKLIWGSGK